MASSFFPWSNSFGPVYRDIVYRSGVGDFGLPFVTERAFVRLRDLRAEYVALDTAYRAAGWEWVEWPSERTPAQWDEGVSLAYAWVRRWFPEDEWEARDIEYVSMWLRRPARKLLLFMALPEQSRPPAWNDWNYLTGPYPFPNPNPFDADHDAVFGRLYAELNYLWAGWMRSISARVALVNAYQFSTGGRGGRVGNA